MKLRQMKFGLRASMVLAPGIAGVCVLFCMPPIPQDPSYHLFADDRAFIGMPRFNDVITNAAFLLAGIHGLLRLTAFRKDPGRKGTGLYALFFCGLILTAFGSAWYHLNPTTESLFWDRLPMIFAFMPFLCIVIQERISPGWAKGLLLPLLVAGAASVVYWHVGEQSNQGDLRFYGLVQYYPVAAIPLILMLFPARSTHGYYFWGVIGCYGLAKIAEWLDGEIFEWTGFLSGHSLKHVLAALGVWGLVLMLGRMKPLP